MSTIDPKKIAFKGTTNTDLQEHKDKIAFLEEELKNLSEEEVK